MPSEKQTLFGHRVALSSSNAYTSSMIYGLGVPYSRGVVSHNIESDQCTEWNWTYIPGIQFTMYTIMHWIILFSIVQTEPLTCVYLEEGPLKKQLT